VIGKDTIHEDLHQVRIQNTELTGERNGRGDRAAADTIVVDGEKELVRERGARAGIRAGNALVTEGSVDVARDTAAREEIAEFTPGSSEGRVGRQNDVSGLRRRWGKRKGGHRRQS
jgi:hypothetical protein